MVIQLQIEAAIVKAGGVQTAAVIAREDIPGEKRIVAYMTPACAANAGSTMNTSQLRAYLKSQLPEFMIPSAFVWVDRFPLTPNGKLDRLAFPPPDLSALADREFEAPASAAEEVLANIWIKLLRVARVGRQDSFFELGGHSLVVPEMIAELEALGWSLGVQHVFAGATLAKLASELKRSAVAPSRGPLIPLAELSAQEIEHVIATVPGGAENVEDIYPLSSLQEGLLFHYLLNRETADSYVMSLAWEAGSRAELDRLVSALQWVVARHGSLRTGIVWERLAHPVQVVYRNVSLPIEEIRFDEWTKLGTQRIDLQAAPLLRLRVAADPDGSRWYAVLHVHHIVADEVSLQVLREDVGAYLDGRAATLPEPGTYRDHIARTLVSEPTEVAESFLRRKLGDIEETTAPFEVLDVHGRRRNVQQSRGDLDVQLAERLRIQARRLNVGVASLFHAAWAMVVSSTSGRDDVVFGSVFLGRLQGGAAERRTVGLFINTLPVRLDLRNLDAQALVLRTHTELVELVPYEQASLALAQRCTRLAASAPLFTSLLNYVHEPTPPSDGRLGAGLKVRTLSSQETTNYPLAVTIEDRGRDVSLIAQTDPAIDSAGIVDYFRTATQSLVEALEQQSTTCALALRILTQAERSRVVDSFNATATAYPREKLVHELFEEQVSRTPDAIAIVDEHGAISYAALNARANQLAHFLSDRVRRGDCVPLLLPRSTVLLVAQLAVLKCGGAYLPVDPSQPAERVRFILNDCGARIVLTDRQLLQRPEIDALECIDCSELHASIGNQPQTNPDRPVSKPVAAYVMYTSGSTGQPKGVIVPHRGVVRLIMNNSYARIDASDCISHSSNPSFDAATFEVWAAWLNGARLVVVPQSVLMDAKRYAQFIESHGVTIFFITVGLFAQYEQALREVFRRARYVITGGDVLDPSLARRVWKECAPGHLINAYGPTECTTFSTTFAIEELDDASSRVPIGAPIGNSQIYILNSHMEPVPIGAPGEIYIGGDGVAVGYLNRPELTAERFIRNPFSSEPDARLYKSGDLGRWRADGTVDFLCRNDQQVKVRGFRIELGEIETQILGHSSVKEAVVIAREDTAGSKRLVAYVTARDDRQIHADALRTHLLGTLPEYMVPSAFVALRTLPLTANGKVDRRVLPPPTWVDHAVRIYEAPQGELEEMLATIWQQILEVEQVGRCDHFFQIGGHSLLATQLLVRIQDALGMDIPMSTLFEYPTLSQLAAQLDERRTQRLLDRMMEGDDDMEELLARVASMSQHDVVEATRKLGAE